MYSDEWLRLGYSSGEQIRVSDFVFYSTWHDHAGNEIGATVDFETANDFHYDIPITGWLKFRNIVLRVSHSDDVPAAFCDFLAKNKGLFDFERSLDIHRIEYQKIAFY